MYAHMIYYPLHSAFRYAQSRILLVFCRSLGFLVPWFSSLTAKSDLADLCVIYEEGGGGGGTCLFAKTISLICLNVLFAMFNFDKI